MNGHDSGAALQQINNCLSPRWASQSGRTNGRTSKYGTNEGSGCWAQQEARM
jgi:hypothetical protein